MTFTLKRTISVSIVTKEWWENWCISAEGATAPETLRQTDHCFIKSGERCESIRRRDNDLRQRDRKGHHLRQTPYSFDAGSFHNWLFVWES